MSKHINIVWLKRDLRLSDHPPIKAAEQSRLPYLIIYIFEPSIMDGPDIDIRHLKFVYHSLLEMDNQLSDKAQSIHIFEAEAEKVFMYLSAEFTINSVFSHEEHGTRCTWERDKRMKTLFDQKGIIWKQFMSDNVSRGIRDRKNWDKQWYSLINMPQSIVNISLSEFSWQPDKYRISETLRAKLQGYPAEWQNSGEHHAWKYLQSFMGDRGSEYIKNISSPIKSRRSCSRLSVYLAWGNISIKQVYQFVKAHPNFVKSKRNYQAMLSRLKWRSHFIQKFEVECDYESRCINKGYEAMPYENDIQKLNAWKNGQTGFPFVDACILSLRNTGWINFRMRAMLVSFLCHHLDVDWRKGHHFLAKQFLDYEPGIHYPQFQMQAGTTGVNTIRIYNPVKQSYEQDPDGVFIKKWLPQLKKLPTQFVHEPWNMTMMEQNMYAYEPEIDYAIPIIDYKKESQKAREKIWAFRKNSLVKKESKRILKWHTRQSRKRD